MKVDANLQKVVEDFFVLEERLFDESDEEAQVMAREYLSANDAVIRRGLEAWRGLSEEERSRMEQVHPDLDRSAVHDSFWSIATSALEDVDDPAGLKPMMHDDIHMLRRALQFARFVADTSDCTVTMRPAPRFR